MTNTQARDRLLQAILDFIAGEDLLSSDDIRRAPEREVDGAGSDALAGLQARLTMDIGWAYYPPDPLARRIHHSLADTFLREDSEVMGLEHVAAVGTAPVTMLANHVSYADANVIDVLLARFGGQRVADRLTAVAGPKVFSSRQRRFSSLCFGTIKVPQSTEVSSGEAVLSAREVAHAARRAIEAAHARLRAGDALLLFAEGTRSRTATMQAILPGAARYLEVPGSCILPVGLTGPEKLLPVDGSSAQPARVVLRLGSPMRPEVLLDRAGRDRRLAMDAIGLAVAELVPPRYRGVYANASQLADASRVLRATRPAT